MAAICGHLGISSCHEPFSIPEEDQVQWLQRTAQTIYEKTIRVRDPPIYEEDDDAVYAYHRTLLHMGYLYVNLRTAIRWENGPEIIRMWRYWLPLFLGAGKVNYSSEAANFLANLAADWSPEMCYIHTHHRTVNSSGKVAHGKPIDQLVEHYNL